MFYDVMLVCATHTFAGPLTPGFRLRHRLKHPATCTFSWLSDRQLVNVCGVATLGTVGHEVVHVLSKFIFSVRCLCMQAAYITGRCLCAEYISLLFTDLGVLTPAAVSDELIQLYS